MFDIDLYKQTQRDVFLVDCNANGLPNNYVVDVAGDEDKIMTCLVAGFLLEEVKLDFDNSTVLKFEINEFEYAGKSIPVVRGVDSLIYHGFEKPLIHEGAEWLWTDSFSKSIKIIRLLSTFPNKIEESFDTYFESITACIKKWIADLNSAINFHNEQVKQCAKKHAAFLHDLYFNRPDSLGLKK